MQNQCESHSLVMVTALIFSHLWYGKSSQQVHHLMSTVGLYIFISPSGLVNYTVASLDMIPPPQRIQGCSSILALLMCKSQFIWGCICPVDEIIHVFFFNSKSRTMITFAYLIQLSLRDDHTSFCLSINTVMKSKNVWSVPLFNHLIQAQQGLLDLKGQFYLIRSVLDLSASSQPLECFSIYREINLSLWCVFGGLSCVWEEVLFVCWKTTQRSGPEELCQPAARNKGLSDAGGRTVLISYLTVTGQDKCVPFLSPAHSVCSDDSWASLVPGWTRWTLPFHVKLICAVHSVHLCWQEKQINKMVKDAVGVSVPWHPDSVEGVVFIQRP